MKVITSPGILLRSHPYSESSRILRFLTPEHGLLSLMGKGVGRRSSPFGGGLETFSEGMLTFSHRPDRELHTLREFQRAGNAPRLGGDLRRFLGASLLGELLLSHALQEGDPGLYAWIRSVFLYLGSAPESELPGWILAGGWRTLGHLGFPPEVDVCVACGGSLGDRDAPGMDRFDGAQGGMVCAHCSEGSPCPRVGPEARGQLGAFLRGELPARLQAPRGHLALLEGFVLHHLAPRREFRSFALLRPLLQGRMEAGGATASETEVAGDLPPLDRGDSPG